MGSAIMERFVHFFNVNIPVRRCNLRCHYCYIGQTFGYKDNIEPGDESLHYSFEHMRRALAVKRLGVCMFNLCAHGETLLFKELMPLVAMLLEMGHFVSIVTNNMVTKPLKELLKLPQNYRDRLFLKCSFHYMELKRLNIIDKFFDNIDFIKRAKTSFTIELTANDETIPLIPEIKEVCMKRAGALCHIVESRNNAVPSLPRLTALPIEEHQAAWAQFASPLFNYQQKFYEQKILDFCSAGRWFSAFILQNGELFHCDGAKMFANIFANPDQPVGFTAIGENCPCPHCYIRYVNSILCNVFDESSKYQDMPTYVEERDRECVDDSHWLTPIMREAFSHRLSEFHKPYSDNKRFFIDLLMRKVYKDADPTIEEKKELATILRRSIHGSVAIIGDDRLGAWFREILIEAKISVKFTVEHELFENTVPLPNSLKYRLRRFLKYWYKRIIRRYTGPIPLHILDRWPKVDAIIVTQYAKYDFFKKKIEGKTKARIVSITQLLTV
jgi:organic radical activating enzyme